MQKKITKRVMGKIFAINVVLITLISLSLFNNTYAETIQTAKTKPKVITKEEAENSKKILELKSLNIENYEFYPEFNSNTPTYYLEIPKIQKSLDIKCETNAEDANIKITGNKKLTQRENLIQIVLSKSGYETRTYNIYALKRENDGPKLSSLSIENGEITPQFNPERYYYNVKVNYSGDITPIVINALSDDKDTTIEIIGNNTDTLVEGDNNIITILLKNSKKTTIYQINATIQKNTIINLKDNNNKNNDIMNEVSVIINKISEICKENKLPLVVASGFVAFIIIIIVLAKIHKKKVKENRQKIKNRF